LRQIALRQEIASFVFAPIPSAQCPYSTLEAQIARCQELAEAQDARESI